jgi:hypothetical protein
MISNIYTLTIFVVKFYFIVMLVLISISEFIIKGIYKIEENKNTLIIYLTLVNKIKNVFEFIFYPFFSFYLISIYFIYNLEWIIIFIGIIILFPFYRVTKNLKKEKGRFFNVPYRQIEISNFGILVNNELLVYDNEKNKIKIIAEQTPTSRSIYYRIHIANNYNSIELIKGVPDYQYKEIENKLVDFLTENGFNVTINMIKK